MACGNFCGGGCPYGFNSGCNSGYNADCCNDNYGAQAANVACKNREVYYERENCTSANTAAVCADRNRAGRNGWNSNCNSGFGGGGCGFGGGFGGCGLGGGCFDGGCGLGGYGGYGGYGRRGPKGCSAGKLHGGFKGKKY